MGTSGCEDECFSPATRTALDRHKWQGRLVSSTEDGVAAECIAAGWGWRVVGDTRAEAVEAAKRHRRTNDGHVVVFDQP